MVLRVAVTLGLVVFSLAVIKCDEQENEAARRAVVQGNNAFSTALYQTVSSQPGNLVMSPLSVAAVMAMTWLGAGGETAAELAAGLHLPEGHSEVKMGFKTLLSSLRSTPTLILEIANKLYVQEGLGVNDTYRQAVVDYFLSDVEEVSFNDDGETVRNNINQWVEEKTHNKIKNLIREGAFEEPPLIVLVNAIYFKGGWRKPFAIRDTRIQPFHLTSNTSVNVSMMHQRKRFLYCDISELNAKALKMLYRGSTNDSRSWVETQSMLLLLPNEIDGLASLEDSITGLNVTNIIRRLSLETVILSLPRFEVKKSLNMKDALTELGITSIFTRGADLSGMTDSQVYVNQVIQKAFVEVTEKGTEAAAALYIEITAKTRPIRTPDFNVNHPFLFLIIDDQTGAILFMGRVVNPS